MFISYTKLALFALATLALLAMAWVTSPVSTLDDEPTQALIQQSEAAPGNSNLTNITISGKTMIIRTADGYTPTVQSGTKPTVILERNPMQKSATVFDSVTVENDRS